MSSRALHHVVFCVLTPALVDDDGDGRPRESLFITTKVPGIGDALAKVQTDLKQLNTSYADLTLLHMPSKNPATNAAQWKSLEQALAQKLTRAIGISNFNTAQITELLKTATIVPASLKWAPIPSH